MKRTRNLILILTIGPVFVALSSGCAAVGPSPGSNIGAHLGFEDAGEAEDTNMLVGGHLEFMPAPFLGVRGTVDYRTVQTYDLVVGSDAGELDVRSVPVIAEGRLYLPAAPVAPFLTAGAGWYFLKYDYSESLEDLGLDDEWTDTFGWHVGGGAVLGIGPRVSLYGEVKAVFLDEDRALDDETLEQVGDLDYDSTYIATGINFKF